MTWRPHQVCVVGLGKIGLPLALQYASRGIRVIGADINPDVVTLVNGGMEPFPGEPELAERLSGAVRTGTLSATTDTSAAVSTSDVVVIVVPLVVDDESRPDFSILDAATESVACGLQPGTLVAYETTLPVGTTRNRLSVALAQRSGLSAGEDFHVVFSPERVYSGRVFADLRRYPKLVGGLDAASEERGRLFYEAALDFDERSDLGRPNGAWPMGSVEAAEFAKLAETTYRNVNIALANEFSSYAERIGVDVNVVIDAANSQPFSHIHRPGVAVGGHCIPVYPRLYTSTDDRAQLPGLSHTINEAMPGHTVTLLEALLGGSMDGARVLVLGAAYRGGVKETAFSGVFPVVEAIEAAGATAVVHDPLFEDGELNALGLLPATLQQGADGAILQAEHAMYSDMSPDDIPGIRAIVDGRGLLDADRWRSGGVSFQLLGDGTLQ